MKNNLKNINEDIIVYKKGKSIILAFVLAFFLGPLGLFYASPFGGLIMIFFPFITTYLITINSSEIGILIGVSSFLIWLIIDWLICILWAIIAASVSKSIVTIKRPTSEDQINSPTTKPEYNLSSPLEDIIVIFKKYKSIILISLLILIIAFLIFREQIIFFITIAFH